MEERLRGKHRLTHDPALGVVRLRNGEARLGDDDLHPPDLRERNAARGEATHQAGHANSARIERDLPPIEQQRNKEGRKR
jgi:hypothetical protein